MSHRLCYYIKGVGNIIGETTSVTVPAVGSFVEHGDKLYEIHQITYVMWPTFEENYVRVWLIQQNKD